MFYVIRKNIGKNFPMFLSRNEFFEKECIEDPKIE